MEHELSDLCKEKFKQLDTHIAESAPVRDDVTKLKQSVEHLQEGYLDIIAKLEKIENKLLGRPPAWVSVVMGGLMSICTGLIVFISTR